MKLENLTVADLTKEELERLRAEPDPSDRQLVEVAARRACEAFMAKHENDFYPTTTNLELLTDLLVQNQMPPTLENFEASHAVLFNAQVYDPFPAGYVAHAPEVTLADVDRMSSDQYKVFVARDPKRANELEASRPVAPRIYNGEHTVRAGWNGGR